MFRAPEGLALETSAFESLYDGQFTLSTQLIKPNYLFYPFVNVFLAWSGDRVAKLVYLILESENACLNDCFFFKLDVSF